MYRTSVRATAAHIMAASTVAVGAALLPGVAEAVDPGDTDSTWSVPTMDTCFCGFFPYTTFAPLGSETGRDVSDMHVGNVLATNAWIGPDVFVSPNTSGSITPYQQNASLSGLKTRTLCFVLGEDSDAKKYHLLYTGSIHFDSSHIFAIPTIGATSYLTHMKPGLKNPRTTTWRSYGSDDVPVSPVPFLTQISYEPTDFENSFYVGISNHWFIDSWKPLDTVLPNGSLWGLNVPESDAALFPAPLELKFNSGDSSWSYSAGALPDGKDHAEFFIQSIALSDAAVLYPQKFLAEYPFTREFSKISKSWNDPKLGQPGAIITQRIIIVRPTTTTDDSIDLNNSSSINVRDNDHWNELAQPSIMSTTSPAYGTTTWDGTKVTYIPNPDFPGNDSFTYTVKDARTGQVTTATVQIKGSPAPQHPSTTQVRPLPLTDAANSTLLPLIATGVTAGAIWLRRQR